MMSKPSKSERKEDRLQQLERQLAEQKKKNAELQKQKTIRLDDEQVESILDSMTQRIEWSTNRIVVDSIEHRRNNVDGFSYFLKWIIAAPFFLLVISTIYFLFTVGRQYWAEGWSQRFALIFVAIAGFDCFILGIEILKEKDRNYVVALFSALVALVALIVTLVK